MLTMAMFTIIPSLDWADSYRPQLEAVRSFLLKNGFAPTNTYSSESPKPVWHLRLYEKGGLLEAMASMLPYLCKKYDQVKACMDYVQDRITAETLAELFNHATLEGTRSGFPRRVSMPYTHSEGVNLARKAVRHGTHASKILTREVLDDILGRKSRGETLRDISFQYHVSRSSVRRALARVRKDSEKNGVSQ